MHVPFFYACSRAAIRLVARALPDSRSGRAGNRLVSMLYTHHRSLSAHADGRLRSSGRRKTSGQPSACGQWSGRHSPCVRASSSDWRGWRTWAPWPCIRAPSAAPSSTSCRMLWTPCRRGNAHAGGPAHGHPRHAPGAGYREGYLSPAAHPMKTCPKTTMYDNVLVSR
jgi:hypothetical protein